MADDHDENTEPSQSEALAFDDGENTQAGMWTDAPIGSDLIADESVSIRDEGLPPELTPPEREAVIDRRSGSAFTMPIPIAEPSVPAPAPARAARAPARPAKKRVTRSEPSVSLEERFPSIRPARGGRLIAFGAIALGTFVSGLVLSSLFASSAPPPPSPVLHSPVAAATSAAPAVAAATAATSPLAQATPALDAGAATPTPAPAPVVAEAAAPKSPAASAKPVARAKAAPAKKVRAKATTHRPSKAAKSGPVAARTAAKASRPSSREEALPWEEADPHRGPNSRVIRTRSGDKSVLVQHNVAITRANGKTVIGKLVDVKNGTVDVLAKGKHVRIAEGDVKDAANY